MNKCSQAKTSLIQNHCKWTTTCSDELEQSTISRSKIYPLVILRVYKDRVWRQFSWRLYLLFKFKAKGVYALSNTLSCQYHYFGSLTYSMPSYWKTRDHPLFFFPHQLFLKPATRRNSSYLNDRRKILFTSFRFLSCLNPFLIDIIGGIYTVQEYINISSMYAYLFKNARFW